MSLSREEQARLYEGIMSSRTSTPMASAVARLYSVPPEGALWELTGLIGAMTLVCDRSVGGAFFLKLYDLENMTEVLFEQELYYDFDYQKPYDWFHTMECDHLCVGVSFANDKEGADFFKKVVQNVPKSQPTDNEPATAKAAVTNKAESKGGGFFKGLKKKIFGQKPEEISISGPTSVVHTSGIKVASDGGFEMHNLPEEWKALFEQAGIKQEDMQDEETRNIVFGMVMQYQGGVGVDYGATPPSDAGSLDSFSNNLQQPQAFHQQAYQQPPPMAAPVPPQGIPVPGAQTSAGVASPTDCWDSPPDTSYMEKAAPAAAPPPVPGAAPPPAPAVPASQPPPTPSSAPPAPPQAWQPPPAAPVVPAAAPPPPPAPASAPPPRPAATGAPPPPPPPGGPPAPPPPPSGPPAPPPPGPPGQAPPPPAPGGGGISALLGDIQKGKTLRKVETVEKGGLNSSGGGMSGSLQAEIHKGVKLRPAPRPSAKADPDSLPNLSAMGADQQNNLVSALAMAIAQRRKVMHGNENKKDDDDWGNS